MGLQFLYAPKRGLRTCVCHLPQAACDDGTPPSVVDDAEIARALQEPSHAPPDTQKTRADFFPHGVVVIREMIDIDHQMLLLKDCMEKVNVPKIGVHAAAYSHHRQKIPLFPGSKMKVIPPVGRFQYNFMVSTPTNSSLDAPCCIELAKNAHAKLVADCAREIANNNAAQNHGRLSIPLHFDSNWLNASLYTPQNGLQFHVDGAGFGWVMVLSLGADIKFAYSLKQPRDLAYPEVMTVTVRSGDAALFNGGVLYHAVTKVYDNTPHWWKQCVPANDWVRVGLQMRMPYNVNASRSSVTQAKVRLRERIKKNLESKTN